MTTLVLASLEVATHLVRSVPKRLFQGLFKGPGRYRLLVRCLGRSLPFHLTHWCNEVTRMQIDRMDRGSGFDRWRLEYPVPDVAYDPL
jgi:hypothetical protein